MYTGETETQRNWNLFFNNENEPKHPFLWGIIIFLIICIGFAVLINYISKDKDATQENSTLNTNHISYEDIEDEPIFQTKVKLTSEDVDEIKTIMDILDNVIGHDIDTLTNYMQTIREIQMKDEFDSFKKAALNKISYYIKYLDSNKKSEYLDKYNDINMIDALAYSFDELNTAYEIDSDHEIHYWYNE